MKFANLYYKRSGRLTIGDDIQLIAIEYLYNYMGIDYNDVVRIGYHELSSYTGEYIVLPISFPFYGYQHDVAITQFSHKIIPVFLGVSFLNNYISNEDLDYLKQYSPIGCRDEYTLNILRKNNVISYLNGCMTATFPLLRKDNQKDHKKIYCIDVPDSFRKYIPKELLEECEFVSHTYYAMEIGENSELLAKKIYQRYVDEAKFIITTRLHGAIPNVAMGIPVIFLKDNLSFRFTGIDRLLKFYSKEQYNNIDWNPKPINYEEMKKKILDVSAKRVWDTYNQYKDIYNISSFYEEREKKPYYIEFIDNTIEFIKSKWSKEESFQYALWGVTQTADMIYKYIKENYPNSNLIAVLDKYKRLKFNGVQTCDKDWLINHKDVFIFVCTGAAIKDSYEFFAEYKIENYYQCCEDGNKHKYEQNYKNSFENVNL